MQHDRLSIAHQQHSALRYFTGAAFLEDTELKEGILLRAERGQQGLVTSHAGLRAWRIVDT